MGWRWDAGIGLAISNSPSGPFTDQGCLFTSKQIGIQNCIDPFLYRGRGERNIFSLDLSVVFMVLN